MKHLRIFTLVVLLLVPAVAQADIGWNDPECSHESFPVMDLVKGCCTSMWFVF